MRRCDASCPPRCCARGGGVLWWLVDGRLTALAGLLAGALLTVFCACPPRALLRFCWRRSREGILRCCSRAALLDIAPGPAASCPGPAPQLSRNPVSKPRRKPRRSPRVSGLSGGALFLAVHRSQNRGRAPPRAARRAPGCLCCLSGSLASFVAGSRSRRAAGWAPCARQSRGSVRPRCTPAACARFRLASSSSGQPAGAFPRPRTRGRTFLWI